VDKYRQSEKVIERSAVRLLACEGINVNKHPGYQMICSSVGMSKNRLFHH